MKKAKSFQLVHASTIEVLEKVEHLIEEIGKSAELTEEQTIDMAIAVTEAVNNAIIHGNNMDEAKCVHIHCSVKKDRIEIAVKDEGEGFIPDDIGDPLDPENLLKESGRGIFILKSLMDEVTFEITGNGTELKMIKKL